MMAWPTEDDYALGAMNGDSVLIFPVKQAKRQTYPWYGPVLPPAKSPSSITVQYHVTISTRQN